MSDDTLPGGPSREVHSMERMAAMAKRLGPLGQFRITLVMEQILAAKQRELEAIRASVRVLEAVKGATADDQQWWCVVRARQFECTWRNGEPFLQAFVVPDDNTTFLDRGPGYGPFRSAHVFATPVEAIRQVTTYFPARKIVQSQIEPLSHYIVEHTPGTLTMRNVEYGMSNAQRTAWWEQYRQTEAGQAAWQAWQAERAALLAGS